MCYYPNFEDPRAKRDTRLLSLTFHVFGIVAFVARYLCYVVSANLKFAHERQRRLQAASTTFLMYNRIWAKIPKKMASVMFRSLVTSQSFSGIAALPLGPTDYFHYNRLISKYARVLLKGDACAKTQPNGAKVNWTHRIDRCDGDGDDPGWCSSQFFVLLLIVTRVLLLTILSQ